MSPFPEMEIENGIPLDQSMSVETGRPEQADPVITTKPSLSKRPWYRRQRILYTIAIVIAIISIGLAAFAILWATGTITADTFGGGSSAAAVSADTNGGTQENGGTEGKTPTATEPPVDVDTPSPAPQDVPAEEQEAPPTELPTEVISTSTQSPQPTATPTALATERTDPISFYVMGDSKFICDVRVVSGDCS